MINYSRGRIVVLDRPALEAYACECYAVVKTEFDRLLPWVSSRQPAAAAKRFLRAMSVTGAGQQAV